MRAPFLRQGVQLLGHAGVFLVVSIDHGSKTATLLQSSDPGQGLVPDVPFSRIIMVDPDVYRARVRRCQTMTLCAQ